MKMKTQDLTGLRALAPNLSFVPIGTGDDFLIRQGDDVVGVLSHRGAWNKPGRWRVTGPLVVNGDLHYFARKDPVRAVQAALPYLRIAELLGAETDVPEELT